MPENQNAISRWLRRKKVEFSQNQTPVSHYILPFWTNTMDINVENTNMSLYPAVNWTRGPALLCEKALAPSGSCLEVKCTPARTTNTKVKLLQGQNGLRAHHLCGHILT